MLYFIYNYDILTCIIFVEGYMGSRQDLEIFIITYNRREKLKKLLNKYLILQVLSESLILKLLIMLQMTVPENYVWNMRSGFQILFIFQITETSVYQEIL